MSCSKCNVELSGGSDVVKCCECGLEFHTSCCKIRSVNKQAKLTWRCEGCRQDSVSVSSQKSDLDNPTVMDLLKSIQKELAESRASNTANFAKIDKSIGAMHNSLAAINNRLTDLEEKNTKLVKKCVDLEQVGVKLESRITILEREIVEIQQYSRNKNLEIRGVPMTQNENIYSILDRLGQIIGVQFNANEVSIAHRLPTPRDSRYNPSIIVQFISREVRQQWLVAARRKRPQTTDLAKSLRPGPVFVGEHLTKHCKDLLKVAKSHVKEGKLAFAWTRDGKIFIKKTPQSPARRVLFTLDVEREASSSGPDLRDTNETPSSE